MPGVPVITVDGPSGTGKGTLCSRLARWLGWHLLDSGALYRILALLAKRENISAPAGVAALVRERLPDVQFVVAARHEEPVAVTLDGVDVSLQLRGEDCGSLASGLAAHGVVRTAILGWQRGFQCPPGLVADGRDMGTVVFPDAGLKVFLTAAPRERAKRRYKQLNAKEINVTLAELTEIITARDQRDTQRALSPLKPADGAAVIDTTDSGKEEVFAQVAELVRDRFGPGQP